MLLSTKQKSIIVSKMKNGASIKEVSDELKIAPSEIYDILKIAIQDKKTITFEELPLSTQIKLLVIEHKYDLALELCNKPENIDNKNIQEQKLKILLLIYEQTNNQQYLEQALDLCKENAGIKSFDKHNKKIQYNIKTNDINKDLTVLLTNIYYGTISKEEIENSNINPWEKSILLISYYEKNNKKMGITYLKKLKTEYKEIKEKLKIINILYERLNSRKTRIYDISIYSKLLNCTINNSYIKKVEENVDNQIVEKVNTNSEKLIIKESNVTEKKLSQPKQIYTTNGTKYNRHNRDIQEKDKKEIEKNKELIIKKVYIKDIFPNEVIEIGKYLYIEMNNSKNQQNAIKAWDNFECLINKTTDDVQAMNRMIRILKRFQTEKILSQTENYDDIKSLKKNIY